MNRLAYLLPLLCLPFCLAKANASIIVSTDSQLCSVNVCPPPPPPTSSYGGLIVNGDFGFGTFRGYSGTAVTNADRTQSGVQGNSNYDYSYAYLGSVGSDMTLYQTFATTPGDTYSISFDLNNYNPYLDQSQLTGSAAYDFSAVFGDQPPLLSFSNPTFPPNSGEVLYHFTAVADSTSTTLLFSARNDPGAFGITDISVYDTTAAITPEPDSFILLGTGALGLVGVARRRVRRAAKRPRSPGALLGPTPRLSRMGLVDCTER